MAGGSSRNRSIESSYKADRPRGSPIEKFSKRGNSSGNRWPII
jgi:hypothetical protein